jgi:hypothetical protein
VTGLRQPHRRTEHRSIEQLGVCMSIHAKRIVKVIIAGEWFTVKLDTFEVVEMEFTDDGGNPLHSEALDVRAYRFQNDNGDEYYGPLDAITLYKLIDL